MSIKIAITNEKGGCGKTTTAVNVSAILAERGYKVLLIDADPQSYSTFYYELYDAEKPSLYEVMFEGAEPSSAIAKTKYFALDVLRASKRMMQAEENLIERKVSGKPVNTIMEEALASLDTQYEYIIIDCPPQGSKLLDNVHCYADYILMPMIPDEFALHSLRIKAENLIALRKDLNPHIQLLGGVIVMDEKNGTKAAYREALQAQNAVPVLRATVRKNITLSRAINAHEPINVYARRSNGNIDYQAVTDEMLGRVAK